MKLSVHVAKDRAGYRAWCPALPGCAVAGGSRREAIQKIELAVNGYLRHLAAVLPRQLERLHTEDLENQKGSSSEARQHLSRRQREAMLPGGNALPLGPRAAC